MGLGSGVRGFGVGFGFGLGFRVRVSCVDVLAPTGPWYKDAKPWHGVRWQAKGQLLRRSGKGE